MMIMLMIHWHMEEVCHKRRLSSSYINILYEVLCLFLSSQLVRESDRSVSSIM